MKDIQLVGTLLTILTSIYIIPIASLHNVPRDYNNRMFFILIPEVIILACLHFLLLQVYHFMEHHKNAAVYIAFGIIASQIALVYSSIFNHWGLSKGEVESKANMDSNTTLNPSFSTMTASGIIHLVSLFVGISLLTVINHE